MRGLLIQPIQPLDATSMFWIEPLDEIVGKELKVNHFNSVCDTHNLKIGVRENLILANQPTQPLFTTCIFLKIEYLVELVGETGQVTQFNQRLKHTYFQKLSDARNYLARIDDSTNSTSSWDTHIF